VCVESGRKWRALSLAGIEGWRRRWSCEGIPAAAVVAPSARFSSLGRRNNLKESSSTWSSRFSPRLKGRGENDASANAGRSNLLGREPRPLHTSPSLTSAFFFGENGSSKWRGETIDETFPSLVVRPLHFRLDPTSLWRRPRLGRYTVVMPSLALLLASVLVADAAATNTSDLMGSVRITYQRLYASDAEIQRIFNDESSKRPFFPFKVIVEVQF